MPNCQVKDMAALVRNTTNECIVGGAMGAVVKIVSLHRVSPTYGHIWNIDHPVECASCGKKLNRLYDADLQPIRGVPPGKSTDDTKQLPKTPEKVPELV